MLTRPDGARQPAVGGRPLYRYAQDTGTGEARGQGVGGTRFAAAPDGGKARQAVDCRPLHTLAGDGEPGDTNGQGVGGTRYAVSPDGKPTGAPE
ncbi:hypothetical protein [Streptomyces roseolilacinus]|uniref:hypothetical protein n=1 Tax=Streptomyces roseolilacinus TaxID=66904 RepID=UPI00380E42A3